MLRVAFAGTFSGNLAEPVRRHLTTTCEIVVSDEAGISAQLVDVDVLVTMALTPEMGRAATCLRSSFRCRVRGSIGLIAQRCPTGHGSRTSTGTRPELPNT